MVAGSCQCGEVRFEVGEPAMKVVCHCLPCRKSSGTPASHNFIYPDDQFKIISGALKTWSRKGDSGKTVTYHSCSTCPSLIRVTAEVMPGLNIVKIGLIDDEAAISNPKWDSELFTVHRLPQCTPLADVQQVETQPS